MTWCLKRLKANTVNQILIQLVGWLVVFFFLVFFFFFLVYQSFETIFQSISGRLPKRGRKRREKINESKNVQTTRIRTHCKCSRPLPYYQPNLKDDPVLEVYPAPSHHPTTRVLIQRNLGKHCLLRFLCLGINISPSHLQSTSQTTTKTEPCRTFVLNYINDLSNL